MDWRSFLVGLIVGWLAEFIIDFVFWRRKQDDVVTMAEHQERLAAAETRIQQLEISLGQKEAVLQTKSADQAACAKKLESATQEIERLKSKLAADMAVPADTAVFDSTRTTPIDLDAITPDPLQKIEGIGPKIEGILNGAGIFTFAQLAAAGLEHLQELLAAAGPRYRLADPGTWSQQAALAHAGEWQELSDLQENLKGGRQHGDDVDHKQDL